MTEKMPSRDNQFGVALPKSSCSDGRGPGVGGGALAIKKEIRWPTVTVL